MKKIDWLPDKKHYEYAYHKFFNPSVKYEEWQPWDEWDYPERDIKRFTSIIKDNQIFIKNKKVLDIGCHLGYISLFCLHNGAEHTTGTNVRNSELEIANEICHNAGYSNCQFLHQNLYDLEELKKLCNTVDTIILAGVLYHVHNHYELIECLSTSSAKNIIIETKMPPLPFENLNYPCIYWRYEDSSDSTSGWDDNKKQLYIGYPNIQWIQNALEFFGMEITYIDKIEYEKENGIQTRRLVMSATKT